MVNTKTKSHQALSLAQCLKMDGCQLPVGGATSSLGPVQGLHYMRVHDGQLKVVSWLRETKISGRWDPELVQIPDPVDVATQLWRQTNPRFFFLNKLLGPGLSPPNKSFWKMSFQALLINVLLHPADIYRNDDMSITPPTSLTRYRIIGSLSLLKRPTLLGWVTQDILHLSFALFIYQIIS